MEKQNEINKTILEVLKGLQKQIDSQDKQIKILSDYIENIVDISKKLLSKVNEQTNI